MKKLLVTQSNYIPWKGYFDGIRAVDEFIVYDEVQYTRRDWRNRNKIKTEQGTQWLTIPVEVKGKYHQKISETRISDTSWAQSHWSTITQNYRHAPFFNEYESTLAETYREAADINLLSEVNIRFLKVICSFLDIDTPFRPSSEFELVEGKNERLLSVCQQAQATEYYSGPSAKKYMDLEAFSDAGIDVHFFDFANYPEYRQSHPPFEHAVTILDLLFNEGPNTVSFLKDLSATSQAHE